MRMEEHFTETMRSAVANEPPALDAWTTFERRARRARRVRFAVSLAGAAAAIAAAAVVVPRLGTEARRIPPVVNPSGSPSTDPYAGWQSFEHTTERYRLRYPPGWRTTMFEAEYEFLPEGLPASAAGLPTFTVGIQVLDASLVADVGRGETVVRSTRLDGRLVERVEVSGESARRIYFLIDWSASLCRTRRAACPDGDDLVLLAVVGGQDTPDLFGRYREFGERVVASIERAG